MIKSGLHIIPIALCLIASGMTSCTTHNEESDSQKVFKVTGDYDKELADRMEVSFLKFQSPDSVVFKASATTLKGNEGIYVLYDYSSNKFLIFDSTGEYRGGFSKRGQGPEEYGAMLSFAVGNDKIYVLDFTKIQVYDMNGNNLQTIPADGERGQLAVDNSGNIYIQHGFHKEYQLTVMHPDGTVAARKFPSEEVVRGFEIPSSPENTLPATGAGVFIAPPLGQTIYQINDTTQTEIATFDFGVDNIPGDFFNGTTGQVENKFHNRRDHNNGFIYMDYLFVSDGWIVFLPVGLHRSEGRQIIFADRANGKTYTDNAIPKALMLCLNNRPYFDGYDSSTGAFMRLVSGDALATALETMDPEDKEKIIAANPQLIDFDEENDDFLLMLRLKNQ